MRTIATTPCPVVAHETINFEDTLTENTTNIEYTTAFDASFRNVKPRRGQPMRRGTTNFIIHEDEEIKLEDYQTTLAQPARRTIPVVKALSRPVRVETAAEITKASQSKSRCARRGVVPIIHPQDYAAVQCGQDSMLQKNTYHKERAKKNESPTKRRNTLYIPPDDTTQPTMWMGIFSPLKEDVRENASKADEKMEEMTGIAAMMVKKRGNRAPNAESRAQRKPLRLSTATLAQAGTANNQPGEPTGKENIPPMQRRKQDSRDMKQSRISNSTKFSINHIDEQRKKFLSEARLKELSQPKTLPENMVPDVATMYEVGKQITHTWKAESRQGPRRTSSNSISNVNGQVPVKQTLTKSARSAQTAPSTNCHPLPTPTKFVKLSISEIPSVPLHPPITEDIQNPLMYEDNWLDHQEIVITQLLNSLFTQVVPDGQEGRDYSALRTALINKYNSSEVSVTFGRVQAATLYGSLSLSHEAMLNIQNLKHDLGRKKAFIKFWLHYNHESLQIALEVVSGRQISTEGQRISQSPHASSPQTKSIIRFIESYMLQHDDGQFKPSGTGIVQDLGSKTILKSVMLIKALDLLKDDTNELTNKSLFRNTSPFKSSVAALQCMMQMLNPAVGDPVRPLRQLGYEVMHVQKPTSEIVYSIDNLALDIRDGVNLARVTEILLYGSKSNWMSASVESSTPSTHAVNGDIVEIDRAQSSPLIGYLKLPCLSRATKIFNVQISLEVLRQIHSMKPIIVNVSADDIVDGHREKTIALLWAMVGQFGLAQLIDSNDLKWEIRRLAPSSGNDKVFSEDDVCLLSTQKRFQYLIQDWARAVAASQGLNIRNFTTAFADGQIFRAIIDEYEPYLYGGDRSKHMLLKVRLSRLGCSQQFGQLFDSNPTQMHIFGKEFVLAALAFLCSRLMGPSKLCRNAVRIQRCWRRYWLKVVQKRQIVKKELASACATSVSLRQCTRQMLGTEMKDEREPRMTTNTEIETDIWLSV